MYTKLTSGNTIPLFLLLVVVVTLSCRQGQKSYSGPPGYNLQKPYIIKLPAELKEISGITYYAKDNSLFAESDEKGCLYKIYLNKLTDIRKWKFGHKKDYEDIVLHDSTFYLLNNVGEITTLNFINDSLVTQAYAFTEKGDNEFESLFYDDQQQKLILMCKDCDADGKTTTSTYTFDPESKTFGISYVVNAKQIEDIIGPSSSKFKPSGASINPVTGELYILSSINKVLVVSDRRGGVKHVYPLDPDLFVQPEGICFSSTGGLFIASEARNMKSAMIYYYQFTKASNE